MKTLYLPVKSEYFDAVRDGSKTEEYRLTNEYWGKRLVGRDYDQIVIAKGYPKKDDESRRLCFPYNGYKVKTITHPHFPSFNNEPVEVFAIELTTRDWRPSEERSTLMKNFNLSLSTRSELFERINKLLSDHPDQKHYVHITKTEKKRGLSANAQQHVFYQQIADFNGDKTALDEKNICKDLFGIGIVLNNEEHAPKLDFLLNKLNYYKHSHESRMKLIQCLSITSLFTPKESNLYMDSMIDYYNQQGINIRYQDE